MTRFLILVLAGLIYLSSDAAKKSLGEGMKEEKTATRKFSSQCFQVTDSTDFSYDTKEVAGAIGPHSQRAGG